MTKLFFFEFITVAFMESICNMDNLQVFHKAFVGYELILITNDDTSEKLKFREKSCTNRFFPFNLVSHFHFTVLLSKVSINWMMCIFQFDLNELML